MTGSSLRIVHVCCTDAFAGVERHIAALAAQQSASGHEVHVVGGDPEIITATMDDPSVRHRPARSVAQAALALRRIGGPSVVNAHMTAAELAAVLAGGLHSTPIVSTRHFAQRRGARRLSRPVVRAAARRIDAQVAVSRHVAESVEGPSTVVHAGVPVRPDAVAAAQRDRVVLMVQRLESEKATDTGLEAFAGSGLPAAGWRLGIAGDGAQRGVLERLAATLGIAHAVDFLGHRRDVAALMDRAALLLAPQAHEGYGLVVVEAMAAGLPVLAAGSGGHLETVGSLPTAATFPPGDADAAGALLTDLAADAARRDAYGRELQALQRRAFTVEAQAAATEAVYRSVL